MFGPHIVVAAVSLKCALPQINYKQRRETNAVIAVVVDGPTVRRPELGHNGSDTLSQGFWWISLHAQRVK